MRFPKLDPYILALASTVILASLLPARGAIATDLTLVSKGLIALLFFLHGTRLSPQAVRSGVSHWRLHLTVMAITFGLFPAIALMVEPGLTLILPICAACLQPFRRPSHLPRSPGAMCQPPWHRPRRQTFWEWRSLPCSLV